ncbi:MAG: FtsQ-type POTRA domain-containing protein [Granulosicoccus sp.]
MSSSAMPQRNQAIVLPVKAARISASTRWMVGAIGLVLLLLASLLVPRYASDPARFPVTNVDVLGTLDYTDRASLRQLIEPHTANGFYALDIDKIRSAVEAMPWVAQAHISRIWPGRVAVEVEEHEPAARWNDNSLISKRLERFAPSQLQRDSDRYAQWREIFRDLPKLSGASGRHETVLDDFRRYDRELELFDVTVRSLDEDKRHSQTLTLSNDVTVRLGYQDRDLRFARFLDVYERLVTPQNDKPLRFDMRYSNGFALKKG